MDRSLNAPLALYVHWPFCKKKCPYCDFNSHVRAEVDQRRWRRALVAEIERTRAEIGPRRLVSIFFGGGTPSLCPPDTVAAVIEAAKSAFDPTDDLEATLEANPTSVEGARFAAFAAAGVSRVSLGVQALNDDCLAKLGREHSAAEAIAALGLAIDHFPRVSFDLIYARPWSSPAAWRAELERALDFGVEHLSLYQLVIEPATRFAAMVRAGELSPLDDDAQADLFVFTRERMTAAGLPAYEISNHARPGAECRHNLVYWRYGEFAGIGPGAHGRLRSNEGWIATEAIRHPERWLDAVERSGGGEAAREPLAPRTRAIEALLMGLRAREGAPLERIARLAERPAGEAIDLEAADRLREDGFLEPDRTALRASETGALAIDFIARELAR